MQKVKSEVVIIVVCSIVVLFFTLGSATYLFFFFMSDYETPHDAFKIVDCTDGNPIFLLDESKLNYRHKLRISIVFEELLSPDRETVKPVWAIDTGLFPVAVKRVTYGD